MKQSLSTKLRVFYYPYSQCLNLDALKRSLLLFDEIWVSDPLTDVRRTEFRIRDYLMWREDRYIYTTWDHSEQELDNFNGLPTEYNNVLVKQGILKKCDPRLLVKKYENELTHFVVTDLEIPEIKEFNSRWAPSSWMMLRDRLPKPLYDFLKQKNEISETREERIVSLPWGHASSILINEALFFAEENDLCLLTDSALHHFFLKNKLVRAEKFCRLAAQNHLQTSIPEKLVHVGLAEAFLNSLVGVEDLAKLSIWDILDIRESLKPKLNRFRGHLWSLQKKISGSVYDDSTEHEIRLLIKGELIPAVEQLDINLREEFSRVAKSIVSRGLTAITPTTIVTTLAGLGPTQIMAFAAAATAGAISTLTPELIKLLDRRAEQKLSPLAFGYLLNQEIEKRIQ